MALKFGLFGNVFGSPGKKSTFQVIAGSSFYTMNGAGETNMARESSIIINNTGGVRTVGLDIDIPNNSTFTRIKVNTNTTGVLRIDRIPVGSGTTTAVLTPVKNVWTDANLFMENNRFKYNLWIGLPDGKELIDVTIEYKPQQI